MSKKRRGRRPHRGGGRLTPTGGPAGSSRPRHFDDRRTEPVDEHPLAHFADLLHEDHPFPLLTAGSMMAWVLEPQQVRDGAEELRPDPGELLDTFIDHDDPATTALLGVLALTLGDERTRQRCADELEHRRWATPPWFAKLGEARIDRVVEMADLLGDGDNTYLELRWPTGQAMTVVGFVDHNLGSVVKDAFAVPFTVDELVDAMRSELDVEGVTWPAVDPATTRARLEQAIDWSNRTWPPQETETWPACQPLLRWVLRLLPAGGSAPEPREWTQDELDALVEEFLASPDAAALAPGDADLVEPICWYGTGYGHGDPFRWGSPRVEILLLDWVPRKIVAPAESLVRLPQVLRAFIGWAHRRSGIPDRLTAEVLATVDAFEDEYREIIADEDPAAMLAAMGALDDRGEVDGRTTYDQQMRELGIRAVGGEAAYEALDAVPLPDEPLDLSDVPDDIAERVRRVAALTDQVCVDHFDDVELRSACRRLLHDVAVADPAIFRRRSKDETAAGAICWVVAKANRLLDHGESGAMLSRLGVKGSVSQRAEPMVRAVGAEGLFASNEPDLGTPRYLTSWRRQRIIDRRDRNR